MKKNQGITLVALVVTIIVLIILAGFSLNLLLGQNGIITRAKETKKAQKVAEVKERLSLEIAAAETDAILRNENLEEKQLEDIISKYGTLQEDKDTILTKDDQYEISLKEIWYGVLSNSGSYSNKVKQVEMLEEELKNLQDQYKQLEETNQGNSELLDGLRKQIENLENEKKALEESLQQEQEKVADLSSKYNQLEEASQGNSELLDELRKQKENLENEKRALEENLKQEKEKFADLNSKFESLQKEKEALEAIGSNIFTSYTFRPDIPAATKETVENLKEGDLIIVTGDSSGSSYSDMHPSGLEGCDLIYYCDNGSNWPRACFILKATDQTVSFQLHNRMNHYNHYVVLKQ